MRGRRTLLTAVLAAAVVLAGCSTPVPTRDASTRSPTPAPADARTDTPALSPSATASPTATPTRTPSPSPTPTPTPSPTPDPTPTPVTIDPADNPWDERELEVGIDVAANGTLGERTVESLRDALAYWTTWSPRYGDYAMRFAFDNGTRHPDIVVLLVGDITACGRVNDSDIVGCAPTIDANRTVRERPQYVYVESGWGTCVTREIVTHEFGHVLGLTHDDEPQPLMSGSRDYGAICG